MRDDIVIADEAEYRARIRRVRERLERLQARKDFGALVAALGPATAMTPQEVRALCERMMRALTQRGGDCPAPA